MTKNGIHTLDETLQVANQWLKELNLAMGWDDGNRSYRLLRATLHALRDRLPAHEAVHLGAQLPMLIRGLYYDGWQMRESPSSERSRDAFLAHIEAAFKQDPNADPEALVRKVFAFLAGKISAGEIGDVKHVLPPDIRALWPIEAAGELAGVH